MMRTPAHKATSTPPGQIRTLADYVARVAAEDGPAPERCIFCGAAMSQEELIALLAWAYGKLAYRSFSDLDDCLKMDEIRLLLMGAFDNKEPA
jgi:hypothetical protein